MINQLKRKKDVNNVLLNAIKSGVESRVALYATKKNRNGLFSPFLFGEFLFWEGKNLPKISEVVDCINHFNSIGGITIDATNYFIFVIPYDDKNKETQKVRCFLTADKSKFSEPKQGSERSPKSDNKKLSDRLAKIITDFGKVLSEADKASLKAMAERYKA